MNAVLDHVSTREEQCTSDDSQQSILEPSSRHQKRSTNDFSSMAAQIVFSLLDHLPSEDQELGTVRRAEATSDGVFFFTFDRLVRWNGQEMKVWRAETTYRLIYLLEDVLYVRGRHHLTAIGAK